MSNDKLPQSPKPVSKAESLKAFIFEPQRQAAMAALLPKHLNIERMSRIAIQACQRNPALLECTQASILLCLISAAQLGLEPGGLMGSAYLVPFKNTDTGKTEAVLIPGYRGLIDLARRSGEIAKIEARIVMDGDTFEVDYGAGTITHRPAIKRLTSGDEEIPAEATGPVPEGFIGAYAIATFKDGRTQIEFMDAVDVDRIRKRSKASKNGPWVTDYLEMARKTTVRRLSKYLPLSPELAGTLAMEDAAEGGHGAQGMRDITPESVASILDEPEQLPPANPAEEVKEILKAAEQKEPVKVETKNK